MHLTQDGIWLCVKRKCELQPKSFTNSYKLQKHQGIHADVLCETSEHSNGSLPNELMPNNLDQAFFRISH